MGELHFRTAARVAMRLIEDGSANAVVLHGSVANGTHRSTSDIDLVAVGSKSTGHQRFGSEDLCVELITRTAADWQTAFARPVPAWTYAWSDGVVLGQVGHSADSLVDSAKDVLRTFRARETLLVDHLEFWEHVRPKLTDAVARGDASEIGYSMGLSMARLVETLFLVNDVVPSPASSARTFARLMHLPAPRGLDASLRRMLAHPDVSLRAREKLELIDFLLETMRTKVVHAPD